MGYTKLTSKEESESDLTDRQACVRAVRGSTLPTELKREAEKFISRNTLPDCGRIAPNCFKAHLLNTASSLNLRKSQIEKIKNLFRSKIGFQGYYLDNGKLRRVQPFNN